MPRVIRAALVSIRDLFSTAGPFILIALAMLVAAYVVLDPTPPKRVTLATGPERSAYEDFGQRYAIELKRAGIEVELRRSAGSRENLRLLRQPNERVDLAFIQGGANDIIARAAARNEKKTDEQKAKAKNVEDESTVLVSLGSLFYEPYWLFYREEAARKVDKKTGTLTMLTQLKGMAVNVGARGSGTPGLTSRFMTVNFMERDDVKRNNLSDTEAVVGLLGGQLDAMAMVSAPEAQYVQMLLQTPGIKLLEFPQAEAYARRYSYITPIQLPRGVADLSRDVPPRDLSLIAATTSLVAREGTHPAIVQLFVQAAARVHSGPGWTARAGQFPTAQGSEFPIAKEAERFYRTGPPVLQRYLPFWLANLIDRMWVALFSIIAILIPLSRLLPPLYEFRVRSRIFRWYRNLREIENDLDERAETREELLHRLDKLDARVASIAVPLSYTDEVYALRTHIDLVRDRLTAKAAA
jgi:TRAP-type uncharacterized transport system substrate-binding protein